MHDWKHKLVSDTSSSDITTELPICARKERGMGMGMGLLCPGRATYYKIADATTRRSHLVPRDVHCVMCTMLPTPWGTIHSSLITHHDF